MEFTDYLRTLDEILSVSWGMNSNTSGDRKCMGYTTRKVLHPSSTATSTWHPRNQLREHSV